MALLDTVKKALRVNHSALDDAEIVPLIEAAKRELAIAGVVRLNEGDPMIVRAVTTYAKAHFGYDNPEADRFERVFNSLKSELSQVMAYTMPSGEIGGGDGGAGGVDKEAIADAIEEYFENGQIRLNGGNATN